MKVFVPIFLLSFCLLSISAFAGMADFPSAEMNCRINESLFARNLTCLNADCSVNVTSASEYGGRLHLLSAISRMDRGRNFTITLDKTKGVSVFHSAIFDADYSAEYNQIFSYLGSICTNDIGEIRDTFVNIGSRYAIFNPYSTSRYTIFNPYSSDEENALMTQRSKYDDCYFNDYVRQGSWLVEKRSIREYCYMEQGPDIYVIDYPRYLAFLATHVNEDTLPYIALNFGIIAIICIVVFVLVLAYHLLRRRKRKAI